MTRALPIALAAVVAALAVPATASAQPVAALDRTVVWVQGEFGAQTLMQRSPDGTAARVAGAPDAQAYRSIDLGRDASNRLVLTYLRCDRGSGCVARRDDLRGHRASIRGLAPRGCGLTTAPALWRGRTAYGLSCGADRARGGLYVRSGSRTRHLARPREAVRAGATEITHVDLRGTEVAAVASDIYAYAFAQTVGGSRRRSFLAAASEGDGDARVRGLALGAGGALWTLVNAEHAGDPPESIVSRLTGSCLQWERITGTAGGPFPAAGLGVDHATPYLTRPGAGPGPHAFAPARPC